MIFALALIMSLHTTPRPRAEPVQRARSGQQDPWLGVDKAKHFLVSAFVQSASYAALRTAGARNGGALAGASVITLAVGLGRETHDHIVGRKFSLRDLTWDVLGAAAASTLLVKTRR
jgi:putative lipoprotein